ncbi:piRNA biogenesis protein EXD1 [Echinops telfairi]|uniref:PiRNA biogenesis protein EXD1 n=1 Tax=Echinops telfairi TaxID=9371 RepID=A0ABM0J1K6_ECHTE|nr:piRNA biogenesis protein EXD1 [Echinops telfairi]
MDPSNDYSFLHQNLWRRVKLTLLGGIFEGVLQHVDPNKIVVLKRVRNVETGRSIPGVKMFFGHEIMNVELLDGVEQVAVREKTSSVNVNTARTEIERIKDEDQKVCEPAASAPEAPTPSLLNDYKFNASEEEEVTYTVIDQFQQKFGAAILHFKKQSVLSVAVEGANVCRHGKLCWLQVATKSRVYLFDIFLLGSRAFNNGLKMVLEDKRILKVIHDCRWLSDCLSHQYGILLNNVFDTQVADVLQFSIETGGFLPNSISTLQESLIRHLKVAPKHVSFLEQRQKLTQPTCMELPAELLHLKDLQKQRRESAVKEYRVDAQGLLMRTVLQVKKPVAETADKEGKARGFLLCKNSRVARAPESEEDVDVLQQECKNKQSETKLQPLPSPQGAEACEASRHKVTCPDSNRSKDQKTAKGGHTKIPKHEAQPRLSLKEEIERLLMIENKDLTRPKQDVSFSPSDSFDPLRKTMHSTLPPCPALEKNDS